MRARTLPLLLPLLLLLLPAPVHAARPPGWLPVYLAALGQSFDVVSTRHFVNTSDCTESNARYTQPPHSPHDPDTNKMWRDKAILVGGIAVFNVLALKATGTAQTKKAKTLRWLAQGTAYTAWGVGTAQGVVNMRCQ